MQLYKVRRWYKAVPPAVANAHVMRAGWVGQKLSRTEPTQPGATLDAAGIIH